MYMLRNIFQFVVDGFYNRTLAEENLVIKWHECVLHVTFQPRYNLYPVIEQPLEQPLRYVSLVCEQFSEHIVSQPVEHLRIPVINVSLCKHEIQKFSPFIAYQMEFEAKIPTHCTLAKLRISLEHLVPVYALVVADWDTSAVNKTYACAPAETEQLEEQHHLYRHSGFQFNETVIGELVGE